MKIHTYPLRFIPEGVSEASQIFLRDVHVLLKLFSYEENCRCDAADVAVWSQTISGVSAVNPLVSIYDIHGRESEVLFFYFVPDITQDI
jgi:hypothetical protein